MNTYRLSVEVLIANNIIIIPFEMEATLTTLHSGGSAEPGTVGGTAFYQGTIFNGLGGPRFMGNRILHDRPISTNKY